MIINPFAFAAAVAVDIAFDPLNKGSGVSLSNSDRTATRSSGSGNGGLARATLGKSTGKWYTEFVAVTSTPGQLGFGVATDALDATASTYLGGPTPNSWAYWSGGDLYFNGSATSGHPAFVDADVIGVAWDATAQKLWFAKNNTWLGSGDPAAGTNEAYSGVTGTTMYPYGDVFGASHVGSIRQASAYSYSPPSGFSAWE